MIYIQNTRNPWLVARGKLMSSRFLLPVALSLVTVLALPSAIQAQEPLGALPTPPSTPQVATAPAARGPTDLELRALGERFVLLRTVDSKEIQGRILLVEGDTIVVRTAPSQQIASVSRASVAAVFLLDLPRPVALDAGGPQVPTVERPTRKRFVGLNFSAAPGFALDVESGLFHGFANVGIILPLASEATIVPFALGLGVGLPVAPRLPNLRLDIFGYLALMADGRYAPGASYRGNYIGLGAGLGMHYTWNNGLTLGFTLPGLGYSVVSPSPAKPVSVATATAYFYYASSVALPLGYVGYRL